MQNYGFGRPAIEPFFEAKSVALVGASERPDSLGAAVFANLLNGGFAGSVHAVNPHYDTLRGRPCYARVTVIPESVDLAVIATPAATVADVLKDCERHGIKAAVILSAGFREVGETGKALERSVLDAARRFNIRFLGPNCLGIMRPKIGLNATFSRAMPRPGRIALVSQSGALCAAMLDWAQERGVGFSAVVSSGIAADVDFGEILDYLTLDTATEAIMLYVEGIHDARRFMSALRSASRAKPVIAIKGGRHAAGGRAARSHTGAIVGSDEVFDAALKRAGVVRVATYANFFAVAETLHAGLRTRGPRIAIVTNGGGPAVIAADAVTDCGLALADLSSATYERLNAVLPQAWSGANPVDVLGDARAERYASALKVCFDDAAVDAVLAIFVPTAASDPELTALHCVDLARPPGKPLLPCWMGGASVRSSHELFRKRGIPSYGMPEEAVAAFAAAAAHCANQRSLLQVPAPLNLSRSLHDVETARRIVAAAIADRRSVLDVVESKAVLAAFGISTVPSMPARSASEAAEVAASVGFPVVMKIHSHDIVHKTDVSGVRLGIRSAREAEDAFREITAAVQSQVPRARLEGVLVEPTWRPTHGRELMLGIADDAVFGPVITVGLGGTLVEVFRDRAVGLAPLNRYLARDMIESTRAARYLASFRGWPAVALAVIEDALLSISDLVCELPEVAELDINPLVVDEAGAVALDARVIVRPTAPGAQPYSHMAIHPYPHDLVGEHRLADGTIIAIRPIRPEDAALERAFVNGLSARSRYLRFMYSMKEISPSMLARFTQIDYDREMALIALVNDAEEPRQIGVARYVLNPDGRTGEFAIVVAETWQHRGLATELLRRLIDTARDRGLEQLDGLVLAENRGMIAFAKSLGFVPQSAPGDPGLVVMSLQLRAATEVK
jgi:acetyltransferase